MEPACLDPSPALLSTTHDSSIADLSLSERMIHLTLSSLCVAEVRFKPVQFFRRYKRCISEFMVISPLH